MFSPIDDNKRGLINRSIEIPEQKVKNDLDDLNFGEIPLPSTSTPPPKSTQIELSSTKRYAVQISDGVYIVEWDTGGDPHEITTDLESVNFTKSYPDIKRIYPNSKVLIMTETIAYRGIVEEPDGWNVGKAF